MCINLENSVILVFVFDATKLQYLSKHLGRLFKLAPCNSTQWSQKTDGTYHKFLLCYLDNLAQCFRKQNNVVHSTSYPQRKEIPGRLSQGHKFATIFEWCIVGMGWLSQKTWFLKKESNRTYNFISPCSSVPRSASFSWLSTEPSSVRSASGSDSRSLHKHDLISALVSPSSRKWSNVMYESTQSFSPHVRSPCIKYTTIQQTDHFNIP